jgi:hypothetical protein
MINRYDIEIGWLIIKEENEDSLSNLPGRNTTRYIPLHPIILRIFDKYNDDIPSFHSNDTKTFMERIAVEMSSNSDGRITEQIWHRRLEITFRSSYSGSQNMQALGMSVPQSLLLTGRSSSHTYPILGAEVEELFFDPFFDFLMPLAEQHGIDGAKVMRL